MVGVFLHDGLLPLSNGLTFKSWQEKLFKQFQAKKLSVHLKDKGNSRIQ
jgi:hypothetical protein